MVKAAQRASGARTDPLLGFDDYIDRSLEATGGVGLSIAAVKGDETVYLEGFGHKRFGDPAKVTPHTVFAIGSTTKAFTDFRGHRAVSVTVLDGFVAPA